MVRRYRPESPGGARGRGLVAALLAVGLLFGVSLPAGAIDMQLQLLNSAPVVISVTPVGLTSPLFPVTPDAGDTKQFNIAIVVQDLNGCNDITSVAITVKDPDGATASTATLTTRDSCSALTLATYTYTHSLPFHAAPGDWNIQVVATDNAGATGNNLLSLTSFRVQELVAVNIETATLEFGNTLEPGGKSAVQSVEIKNRGNVAIDPQVSGTALTHGTLEAEIPLANITWSLQSDMSSPQALTGSATTATGFSLAKGDDSSGNLYWQVDVPKALPAGTYTGTLTLGAVKND